MDFESRLVPKEYQSQEVTSEWSYMEDYMTWFYMMSHPYMKHDASRRPPRPAHEEIMENEQAMEDHVVDVFPRYQTIMWLARVGIESGVFMRGRDEAVVIAQSIISKAQSVVAYRRKRKNQTVRIRHTQ